MSTISWEEEFCPVKAMCTCTMSKLDILEHSLMKWMGTTKANLKKHDVYFWDHYIKEISSDLIFIFGVGSCSLCSNYLEDDTTKPPCAKCPLGEFSKNKIDCLEEFGEAYLNTEPMIDLLFKAYEKELDKVTKVVE